MHDTFGYLDLEQFRLLYSFQSPRKMKFYVEGIKCSKCISKIERLKIDNEQVQTLEVDLANQMTLVELKSANCSFARIADDIAKLGFHPVPVRPSDDTSEIWRQEAKKDLIRLGVAGFCAGNIMFLAFSVYFGLNGSTRTAFEWLQFVLYLPVVTYVAWPFYQGFLSGIKQRGLSIDGPMAIASFLGFSFSTWNLIKGNGSIYFDSTSGFLFLILATRFFQKKVRFEYLKFLKPSSLTEVFKARLVENQNWRWVRSDKLQRGDKITVERGEWVPADGILLNPEATLDLSILNGESYPRKVYSEAKIKAGSRVLSDQISMQVEKSGTDTFLGRLLSSINTSSAETDFSRLSNKASQILLIVVLTIAAGTLLYGIWGNFEHQFEKAFALIVLACPCAMAFGTPLAFSFSMKKAQEKGIIIKSVKIFDDLEKIDTIFLDKTGTLTDRFWSLENSSLPQEPLAYKQFILMLESKSEHPIAYALREIWSDVKIPEDIKIFSHIEEIPSLGVQGRLGHKLFKFQHFVEKNEKWFGLFEGESLLWKFQLKSVIRQGSLQTIKQINNSGCTVYLVSGDKSSETQAIAHELNICPLTTFAELTPEMKESLVRKKQNAIMIGDGVNDALALKAAKVGIAVNGSVDVALKSAGVLFLNGGIDSLPELFRIAKQARQQIKKNLRTALIYNAVGGFAALMGFINPFVAALLMPASSIYILISTWWGTRK